MPLKKALPLISQRELRSAYEIIKLSEKIVSDLKRRIAGGAAIEPGPISLSMIESLLSNGD